MIELRVHRAAPMTLDKGQVVSFTQHPDYYMHGGAKATIHLLDGRTIHLDTPYSELVRLLNGPPEEVAAPPSQGHRPETIVTLTTSSGEVQYPWASIRHVAGPAPDERYTTIWFHGHQEFAKVLETVSQVISAIEMAKHADFNGRRASSSEQRAEARRYHNVGGDNEIAIDEDALVSIAPDAYWIQAWLRVPKE